MATTGEPFLFQRVLEQPGELGALALLFVLEVHEDVATGGGLAANGLRPARDGGRRVALVPQAKVRVVRGDPDRRGHLLAVGNAQRQVPRTQPLEHFVAQPRVVAELERGARLWRKVAEEGVEKRQ